MKKINRRFFLGAASVLGAGMAFRPASILAGNRSFDVKPAILGGAKAFTGQRSKWPIIDNVDAKALLDVLYSGIWGRLDGNNATAKFEKDYAELLGVNHCLAVNSGTFALYAMLGALNVGPGDEVIIPIYTFIATYNSVILHHALPIIVDIDPESFQIDPQKIKSAITKETKVIMPVHIGGSPADLDAILEIGSKNKLPVIEDACQAHMAEWKGKKVGTFGIGGAYSFQSSKNLNCGEGGAITTNDENFLKACYGFHHQGEVKSGNPYAPEGGIRGGNLRITEFQATLLSAQMTRLEQQAKIRSENASYLSQMLSQIPGMAPAKLYPGTTNCSYHMYMFRYDGDYFAGMSKSQFIRALSAEGVSCMRGYGEMEKTPFVTALAKDRHYLKIYGEKTMKQWLERIQCPQNAKVSNETALWLGQTTLLGSKANMEQIAEAIRKIQAYAKDIKDSFTNQ